VPSTWLLGLRSRGIIATKRAEMKRGDMGYMGYFPDYSNNYSFFSLTVNNKNDPYNPYSSEDIDLHFGTKLKITEGSIPIAINA
jgi:hypothetical protein